MQYYFEKPLPVGKIGNYILVPDSSWLGTETITSHTVTVVGGETIARRTASNVSDGEIVAYLEGVAAGSVEVLWEWSTGSRSDCARTTLEVVTC